jgi:hypothetical protein
MPIFGRPHATLFFNLARFFISALRCARLPTIRAVAICFPPVRSN